MRAPARPHRVYAVLWRPDPSDRERSFWGAYSGGDDARGELEELKHHDYDPTIVRGTFVPDEK
jgi:hypothetical protein